jgi:hypothetical protein
MQKTTCCKIPFILNIKNRQIHRDRMYIGGHLGPKSGERVELGRILSDYKRVQVSFVYGKNI